MDKGKIVEIGYLWDESAEKVVDAEDMIVTPGFIDVHSHSDLSWLVNRDVRRR